MKILHRLEDHFVSCLLALMVVVPIAEIVVRRFDVGIPGALPLVQHLTLWVGFLGAAIAAREDKLLSLATGEFIPEGRWRDYAQVFTHAVGALVSIMLAFASAELVLIEKEGGIDIAAGVPVWFGQVVMPIAFAMLALRLVYMASYSYFGRAVAALGLSLGVFLGMKPELLEGAMLSPGVLVLLLATLLGAPIYVALGGFALFLFLRDAVPAAAIPAEMYRLAVSPTLAAIPLFTLTGFLLAEGQASQRLLRLFRGLFGWMPGGTAVVAAVVCAFFTVFTGGSGVTILALGGILFPALLADQYRERFSLGLLTASGSLGLLLPPALPLILYGIVARVSIEDLFIGGIVPGILLIGLVALWGVREGIVTGAGRTPFDAREARAGLWQAKWELLLPIVVVVAIFSGVATIVEASALSAFYAILSQCFIHRDLGLRRDLPRVLQQCAVLIGGVLIILCVAIGLSNWMVDAQVASKLVELVQNNVESKWVFLLGLNIFLLLVGCLMDIFAATVVVVPLIIPLGAAYGIHPIHLGIIFIANLELGYLTPPVGLNLFLSSYRFERPLLQVYRSVIPMLIILGIGVLLITYVPSLTLGLLSLRGDG